MTPRSLVVLLLFVATTSAPAKELSGRELKEFLGPVPPTLINWTRSLGRDEEIYSGVANPPRVAKIEIEVGISRGPWFDLPPMPEERQLGIYRIHFTRPNPDGTISRYGIVDFGREDRYGVIRIEAGKESDFDQLIV